MSAEVLLQAGTAEAQPRVEVRRADPGVEAEAPGHLMDIRAEPITERRDLVDERDPHRQKRVRRVLDHLRRGHVRLDERHRFAPVSRVAPRHRSIQDRLVERPHNGQRALRGRPDNDPIGVEEVDETLPLPEELGIGHDVEVLSLSLAPAQDAAHQLHGPHGYGALDNHNHVLVEVER